MVLPGCLDTPDIGFKCLTYTVLYFIFKKVNHKVHTGAELTVILEFML